MTASGNTSLTSCADTPENLSPFLSYPSDSASSLCSYVNPFNLSNFATAFSIGWISVLSLISEVKAVMLPVQVIVPVIAKLLVLLSWSKVNLVDASAVPVPEDVRTLLLPSLVTELIATTTVLNVLSPAKNVVLFLVPLPRRARGTVPDDKSDASKFVNPDPLPVIVPETDRLSLTETVPPAESNLKSPADVLISLSSAIPSLRLSI